MSCKSSTLPNNLNITCNQTSEVRRQNTSTGQFYCECDESRKFYLIYDRCGTCQLFTKYNPDTKSCELDTSLITSNSVYFFDSGRPITVGGVQNTPSSGCTARNNKILVNGSCRCISTAIQLGTECIICPANSVPNTNQTLCQCGSGYSLATTDFTCRLTSIRQ